MTIRTICDGKGTVNTDYTLPPVPHHPEPRTMRWTETERKAIADYGHDVAEHVRAEITPRVVEIIKERDAFEAKSDRLRAEVEALRECLRECADDLAAEVSARASGQLPRRIERDMEPVRRARKLLAAQRGEGE